MFSSTNDEHIPIEAAAQRTVALFKRHSKVRGGRWLSSI
jgi:hypothetical protein